jgi:putative ABC transport system permease protein
MRKGIELYKRYEKSWGFIWVHTYVLFRQEPDLQSFESRTEQYLTERLGDNNPDRFKFDLINVRDIRLFSNYSREPGQAGTIKYVIIFSTIAVLIVLLACINYINLNISESFKRNKEISMRMVLGGFRKQIGLQLFCEYILSTFIAITAAIFVVYLALPSFTGFTGINYSLTDLFQPFSILIFIGILSVVSIIACAYPALLISANNPIEILKGIVFKAKDSLSFKNYLIIFQYSVSIFLIVGTLVIYNQINYMKNSSLGIKTENLINVPIEDRDVQKNIDRIKDEFMKINGVSSAALSSEELPSKMNTRRDIWWEGAPADQQKDMYIVGVDWDYFDMLGIEFLEGRNFSRELSTDVYSSYIINESAMEYIGWKTAEGKQFKTSDRQDGQIIGVVKNHNFRTLHYVSVPVFYLIIPVTFRASPDNIFLKIEPERTEEIIAGLKSKWTELSPYQPFNYYFVDANYKIKYDSEEKTGRLFTFFTIIALVISSVGLYGLSSVTSEQRTKEIAIRKSLGASTTEIVTLLSKAHLILVLAAMLISFPISWLIMKIWLQNFANQINLHLWIFFLAGLSAAVIAQFAVSRHVIKSAMKNPVISLRCE